MTWNPLNSFGGSLIGVNMSAIERFYASLPLASGPFCAEDEDDFEPMSAEEEAVFVEESFKDF
jgi:hypothetical protein